MTLPSFSVGRPPAKLSKGQRLLFGPDMVAQATAGDLARLLTVLIRDDRFSERELADAFESGMLE